jgi:hypothetical protein
VEIFFVGKYAQPESTGLRQAPLAGGTVDPQLKKIRAADT